MHVHPDAFRRIVTTTLGSEPLRADDAAAVIGIAYLALGADDREDPDEVAVVDEIAQQVCALANTAVAAPGVRATDDFERLEKIRELGGQLSAKGPRELAYALAYAVSISDMDLAPAETELLADVAVAFGIADARAAELAATVAEAVTPPG
jgi:hypothetical protein